MTSDKVHPALWREWFGSRDWCCCLSTYLVAWCITASLLLLRFSPPSDIPFHTGWMVKELLWQEGYEAIIIVVDVLN